MLWFVGFVLLWFLRRSFRGGLVFFKKILEFVVVSCFALGAIFLLMWSPVLQTAKENKPLGPLWILLLGTVSIAWIIAFLRIFLFRKSAKLSMAAVAVVNKASQAIPQRTTANVPNERFADLGGMDDAKDQIRQMVETQLRPERSKRYGLSRNGILLYGPRGTGKTLLARATAGEFGLNLVYVSAPKLLNRWIGATGENIHAAFADAAARKPDLLFIDEIDALGAGRQDAVGDPGGAGREFNNVTMALMSDIDQYREAGGLVLMAATNRLDGLDDALLREGRFDLKIRIDLPDEAERLRILEAQVRKKPSSRFDLG